MNHSPHKPSSASVAILGPVDVLAVLSLALGMLVFLNGCVPGSANVDPNAVPTDPTWRTDIQPIMERHCVRCHETGGVRYEGVAVNTYEAAIGELDEVICTSIGRDVMDSYPDACNEREEVFSMPPGAAERLDIVEQVTLAIWATNGAPE